MSYLISFGCPRSGTTYLKRVIRDRGGRLRERSSLHPCNSSTGLLELDVAFGEVAFVRIYRDPLEVAASLVALRLPALRDTPPGAEFRDLTNAQVVNLLLAEEHNFALQRAALGDRLLCEIDYNRLVCREYRAQVAQTLGVELEWMATFRETPYNAGRLSAGLHEDPLGDRRSWWENQLSSIKR